MLAVVNREDLIKGVAIGVGVCTIAYIAYKKNEEKVNSFLNERGFNIENSSVTDYYSMSIENLMEAKETIEDIIAERELSGVTIVSSDEN